MPARSDCIRAISTSWPRPPSIHRACSAARMPARAWSPASTSATATPTRYGLAILGSGQAHQPSHPLDQEIESGHRCASTFGAESGDRAVDQPGVDRTDRFEIETELSITPGRKFSMRTSARATSVRRQIQVGRPAQIEGDALLVPVDGCVVRAGPVVQERWPVPGVVAAVGSLDLDDRGTHVGEVHRAQRACQHPREIGDNDPIQCSSSSTHPIRRRAPDPSS